MTCHISSELTPRRRKTQSVEVGGPNAKDVALGKASQPGDAGGIVISLKAVSGEYAAGGTSARWRQHAAAWIDVPSLAYLYVFCGRPKSASFPPRFRDYLRNRKTGYDLS